MQQRRLALPAVLGLVALVSFVSTTSSAEAELPPGGTFIDDDSSIHEGAIEALVADGIARGCTAEPARFCPEQPVTRGQVAAFLARDLDVPASPTDWFDDDDGHIFEPAIDALRHAGITSGCDDAAGRTFCPDAALSRAQMAALLVRAFGLAPSATDSFVDDDGSVHEPAIDALHAAGVTEGCSSDGRSFCPSDVVTRAQLASFLARALGLPPTPPPPRTTTTTTGAANTAPTLTATNTTLAYAEGDGPVAVDPAVAVVDDGTIASATVAITSGYVVAEDALAFTPLSGITASFDPATGTLSLSGTASATAYETALRSVTYENTAGEPTLATRTASFQVTDTGGLTSNTATRDIMLVAVDDAPVVTTSAGSTPYTEGDPPTAVDSGLTVTDSDDVDLEGAQVAITSGFQPGDDLLFTNQNGITGSYDAGTGVLTLTGTSSVADYTTALRSVQFRSTNDAPSTSKTVELTADDGDATSPAATRSIGVTAVNDAPAVTTSGGSAAYTEGGAAVAVDPALTVADPDNTELSGAIVQITGGFVSGEDQLGVLPPSGITGSYDSSTGRLTLSGTASVAEYQAALRSVTYTNTSGDPSTATRTVSFQVTDTSAATSAAANRNVTVAASGV